MWGADLKRQVFIWYFTHPIQNSVLNYSSFYGYSLIYYVHKGRIGSLEKSEDEYTRNCYWQGYHREVRWGTGLSFIHSWDVAIFMQMYYI